MYAVIKIQLQIIVWGMFVNVINFFFKLWGYNTVKCLFKFKKNTFVPVLK